MCIAIPGQIITINENNALVNIMGVKTTVNIQLVLGVETGDYVLIHAGCAIEKIQREYYNFLENTYKYLLNEDG
jgi:hydrogenase assembly chaperone HypC/HupF